ncbi:MAG: MFS transporter [Chloroflexota bacterium]|nr:MAG: MFS transporter [Chloroflexota bacterium]
MKQGARRSETPDQPSDHTAFAALHYRDFRLFWCGGIVSLAGTQMQQAAIAWQIYLLAHSPVALGLIGLFRVVPIIAFSLWGGVLADTIDRRRLLLITQSALLLLSASLTVLTLTGAIGLWMIYVLTACAATATAFDSPARQALVPSLVPRRHLTNALSLNSTGLQVALVIGPSLAGVLIATFGVASVYLIDAITFLAVLAAVYVIRPPVVVGAAPRVSVGAAIEGLKFMRATPIIMQLMVLDFAATFFGSATALLPIFARDILHVGSQGYGLLYAAPAAGAVLAGVALAFFGARIRAQGPVILVAVAAYACFTVLFGASRAFPLSLVLLAGTGASDTVSMILRQTVRQGLTPDALRGRMSSVNMIFFMGGPQLGELEAGFVARSFGAPFSVVLGGAGALVATFAMAVSARSLRDLRNIHR